MATPQVLPKEVRLSAPPTMPQARSYLFKQQSSLSSYSPGTTGSIQINLPRLQRSYLTKDSYLKFRLNVAWDNDNVGAVVTAPCFDNPGALGLIDQIEVYDYLGSTLLERTSGHGQLMCLLMDTQCNPNEIDMHYGTASGTKGNQIWTDFDVGGGINKYSLNGPNCGQILDKTANDGTTRSFEYTIPLFSFLGLLSQKFAPLHNGYTIQLTLNTVGNAFGFASRLGVATSSTAPSTYSLTEVYFCAQVLELGPVAESMLIASTQGQPFVVPAKAYRNFVGFIPAATSNYRLDLNLNVASLTNVLFIMRQQDMIDNTLWKSLSYRIRNYLQYWYFQYGSTILPQTTGIQCRQPSGATLDAGRGGYTEAYNELMKARHNLSASNFNSSIERLTYWTDTPAAAATYFGVTAPEVKALTNDSIVNTGKFAGGLDLELVSGRSNELVCGMNTNGMNTSINLTFDPAETANIVASRLDTWCEYDAFINISPGIATTVSF